MGASPMVALNFAAKLERERPTSFARSATVQRRAGDS